MCVAGTLRERDRKGEILNSAWTLERDNVLFTSSYCHPFRYASCTFPSCYRQVHLPIFTFIVAVYGNVPVSNVDNAGKTEQKKGAHAPTFFKPKIPQLETRTRVAKVGLVDLIHIICI